MAGMNNIAKVIASKLDRRREDDARFSELENEISETRQRMSVLSPTADFAQYFKLERRVNNLTDKCKIIISSRRTSQPNSRKLAIALRLTALFVSLALAFHSSDGTKLFIIDANYLYPFNFLLDFPFSVADFRWSGVKSRQSVETSIAAWGHISPIIIEKSSEMVKPWTFALVKPDGVANPIAVRWLLSAMHSQGFVITDGCRLLVSPDMASELYSKHQGAFYYGRLIRHVCSGPSVAMRMELRGRTNNFDSSEAINRWRTLLGPSKLFANIFLSGCAEFDQIRHKNFRQMFGLSDTRNFCHGSDSLDSLYREFSLFEGNMRPIERPEIELFALDAYSLSEADYNGTGGGGEDHQSEGEEEEGENV
uniref:Nucleoside diphosphate kinase n=1 Tax=Globodera rostochiensis TaxID=31243 RepID=A0A914HFD9_GLORO